jgi:hypothetical protein
METAINVEFFRLRTEEFEGVLQMTTLLRTHARRMWTAAVSKSSHRSPATSLGRRPVKKDNAIINWQSTRSANAEMMSSASSSV